MSDLRSTRIEAAIDRSVDRGDDAELFDLLERGSGLPGPRPNVDLARAAGRAIALRRGRADRLVLSLCRSTGDYLRIVGAFALAARWLAGVDPVGAMVMLQHVAEDERHTVRAGVVSALRELLVQRAEAAIVELAGWMDGYLQAHVVLQALADKDILTRIPSSEAILERLTEAFVLADSSPRAQERSQGLRALRGGLPAQISIFAARFPEVFGWLERQTQAARPESREVVAGAIAALRKSSWPDSAAAALTAKLAASAPPPRDPSRIVAGTRKRGKGRHRRGLPKP